MEDSFSTLLKEIEGCRVCAEFFEYEPRPVISVSPLSKILIIGQAPGTVVHNTGIAWNDKSGNNLRKWMGVSSDEFYNTDNFGIVPMGFCYPGKGKSGDLPPRKECAPLWHQRIFSEMKNVKLTLLIGKYAQDYYLKNTKSQTLTDSVKNYKAHLPNHFVLPHPSPRNNIWMAKNPWFQHEVIPELQHTVSLILKH